jgi:hypothetical protein
MATLSDVSAAARKLSFAIPPDHEADYLALLGTTDWAVAAVMAYPGAPTSKRGWGDESSLNVEITRSPSTRSNILGRIFIGRCQRITS